MKSSISSFFLKILKNIVIIFFLLLITFKTKSETLASQTVVTLQKTLKEISQKRKFGYFFKNT